MLKSDQSEVTMYLAGDLGGTKTLLAEFEPRDSELREVRRSAYHSQSYDTFEEILGEFLARRDGAPLQSACFGVAGTVVNGRCQTTNLSWVLSETDLQKVASIPKVKLLNDLEATAYGMLTLPAADLAVLNPGASPSPSRAGHIGVIAAGTGLGEAMLFWDGAHYHPVASEGGHADYAPRDEREVALWHDLRARFGGHISYERVLSGPGFLNIYTFLKNEGRLAEPDWLAEKLKSGDPNAVISEHGLMGDDPLCAETLAMFASAYGAEAGNLALRCVAVGGVFIGGGIAPKLLPALRSPAFLDSFADKGRFSDFLRGIEVSVSLNSNAALLGAAHYATRLYATRL
jgi:glucokinase